MEANKLARRKCWETGTELEKCGELNGMYKMYHCKKQFNALLECCHHEQLVEMDKMRRDTKKHNEWYWLCLYDEDGEIGRQAEWEPETHLPKIWGSFIYNMVFKDDKKSSGMTNAQRQARLEELRRQQGCDIDATKDDFVLDFHIDEVKAMALNGSIDKQIYNV